MPKTGRNEDFVRTYKDILISYINELNENGATLSYENLTEKEQLELTDILLKESKKNILPFMKHILGVDVYWFHKRWFSNWVLYRNMCNVAPRGCGKTYFFTGILPTWLAFSKPNYGKESKIFEEMIVAYNEVEAKRFLGQVRRFIEENQLLSNIMGGGTNTDWNKLSLETGNQSIIAGRSFSGHLRGAHLKYMAVDDVLNDDSDVTPEQMRLKINNVILPMLRRKRGKFNIVGTLFNEDDIYHYMEEKAKDPKNKKTRMFGFYKIWVELDYESEKVYICEYDAARNKINKFLDTGITDIYDYEDLMLAKEQEPISFAREYECKIVSDADVPFPWEDLKACCNEKFSYRRINPMSGMTYCSGLDSSNSMKKDADSTVLMIGYTDKLEKKDVVADIYEDNFSAVPERLREITKRLKKWNNAHCLAEKNSMGETNIQFLNDKSGLRIEGITTSRESKIDFTEYASVKVKRHEVIFPYATLRDREITDKLISQLAGVAEKRTRTGKRSFDGTTKHDDLYISFALMMKSLFKNKGKTGSITSYTREFLREEDNVIKEEKIIDELRSLL